MNARVHVHRTYSTKHEAEEPMWHGVAQAVAMAQVLRTCTMATIVEKTP